MSWWGHWCKHLNFTSQHLTRVIMASKQLLLTAVLTVNNHHAQWTTHPPHYWMRPTYKLRQLIVISYYPLIDGCFLSLSAHLWHSSCHGCLVVLFCSVLFICIPAAGSLTFLLVACHLQWVLSAAGVICSRCYLQKVTDCQNWFLV